MERYICRNVYVIAIIFSKQCIIISCCYIATASTSATAKRQKLDPSDDGMDICIYVHT